LRFGRFGRFGLFGLFGLFACQSTVDPETPAVIAEPSPAAMAELEQTITTALGGTPVSLNSSVFSQSNLLTLDHQYRQSSEGRMATGRTMEKPEQFRLIRVGTRCELLRVKTGDRLALRETKCQAEVLKEDSG
jgi:hypothetical protein